MGKTNRCWGGMGGEKNNMKSTEIDELKVIGITTFIQKINMQGKFKFISFMVYGVLSGIAEFSTDIHHACSVEIKPYHYRWG